MNTEPGVIRYVIGSEVIEREFGHIATTPTGKVKAHKVSGHPDNRVTELVLELGPAVPYEINRNGDTDE